ncbi:hypothetical protein [Streptomyces sp. NPDC088766]
MASGRRAAVTVPVVDGSTAGRLAMGTLLDRFGHEHEDDIALPALRLAQ